MTTNGSEEANVTIVSGTHTVLPTAKAPELRWVARSDTEARHAFRAVDGLTGLRSLCGLRWQASFGSHGAGQCPDCAGVLRQVLAGRVTLG
jgi:hypothetical protein